MTVLVLVLVPGMAKVDNHLPPRDLLDEEDSQLPLLRVLMERATCCQGPAAILHQDDCCYCYSCLVVGCCSVDCYSVDCNCCEIAVEEG